jgi:hypothetical protein
MARLVAIFNFGCCAALLGCGSGASAPEGARDGGASGGALGSAGSASPSGGAAGSGAGGASGTGTGGTSGTGTGGTSGPGDGGPNIDGTAGSAGGPSSCRHLSFRDDAYAFELRIVNTSEFYKLDFPPALMDHCIAQRGTGGTTDPNALQTKCEASYLFKKDASTAPASAVTESFDILIPFIPPEGFDITIARGGRGSTQYEIRGLDGTTWLAFDSTQRTVHVAREALKPGGLALRLPATPAVGPKRGAYMFPWYGTPTGPTGRWQHWNPDEPTLYAPAKGAYDSRDKAVIATQMAEARSAGLDLFVVSYWDTENPPLLDYLDAADQVGIEISAMLETATRSASSPRQSTLDQLNLLVDRYGAHRAWLKANGKPIVFVYDRVSTEIDDAPVGTTGWDDWQWIQSQMGAKTPVLMFPVQSQWSEAGARLFGGLFAFAANSGGGSYFNGSHGDDWAWAWEARQAGALLAIPILPSIGRLRQASDEPNYSNQWHAARSVMPDMIIVNSWNEYHESTIIEPTTGFGTQYLELTKREGDLYCAGEIGALRQ